MESASKRSRRAHRADAVSRTSSLPPTASGGAWFFSGTAAFLAPLVALVAIWQATVTIFDVHPGVFPGVPAVVRAGVESIRDGSLFMHVGASFARVLVGTALALLAAIPLGVAMGVSPVVSSLLTPLFRFFSVLAGIAWIPIATLWFGYGFGAITFVIFNAVFFIVAYNTLLGVSTIPMPLRNAAASLGAGRHPHRPRLRLARAHRGRDDRHQRRARLHAFPGAGFLPYRGYRIRHDRDRDAVASHRPPAARAA